MLDSYIRTLENSKVYHLCMHLCVCYLSTHGQSWFETKPYFLVTCALGQAPRAILYMFLLLPLASIVIRSFSLFLMLLKGVYGCGLLCGRHLGCSGMWGVPPVCYPVTQTPGQCEDVAWLHYMLSVTQWVGGCHCLLWQTQTDVAGGGGCHCLISYYTSKLLMVNQNYPTEWLPMYCYCYKPFSISGNITTSIGSN